MKSRKIRKVLLELQNALRLVASTRLNQPITYYPDSKKYQFHNALSEDAVRLPQSTAKTRSDIWRIFNNTSGQQQQQKQRQYFWKKAKIGIHQMMSKNTYIPNH